ncbi:PAS domain S-box protein [Polaromonas sp.]|uniref:PAS domain-containing protein n=1 Tax=Polaromonas sp. TaxID=1869339 RepID=UPI001D69ECDB|nr:PAS domain S-box protein [Polaromonas sp.]MBT9476660.1 PAS domain S-box protein [Polaromonas sp.]
MKKKSDASSDDAELRRRAEQQVATHPESPADGDSARRLLHELQVYKIELEMQNEALREAQEEAELGLERYVELYDHAPVGYLTLSRTGIIDRANLAAAGLLGLERGKLIRRNFEFFVARQDVPAYRGLMERVYAGGAKETVALALAGQSQRFVRVEASADETGTNARVALLDITERKRAEQVLKDNEEKFRSIYEGSNDAIMLLTDKGFFDCNARTLELFGLGGKDEFIFLHPSQLSPPFQPDGRDSFSAANEKIEAGFSRGSGHFEWVHQRKNGEVFPADVSFTAFTYQGHRVLQATVRDITERKRAEAAILQLNEDLERKTAGLESANRVLQAFSDAISQDLRGPLQALDSCSRLLRKGYRDQLDAEGQRLLQGVRDNAEKMVQLMDELLVFSRVGRPQPAAGGEGEPTDDPDQLLI